MLKDRKVLCIILGKLRRPSKWDLRAAAMSDARNLVIVRAYNNSIKYSCSKRYFDGVAAKIRGAIEATGRKKRGRVIETGAGDAIEFLDVDHGREVSDDLTRRPPR
jgi:hypothetical protein